jgi:hypothetical protein
MLPSPVRTAGLEDVQPADGSDRRSSCKRNRSSRACWERRRRRSTAGRQASVDPVSLQAPDERTEVALEKPALGDLRDPRQDLVLRGAIAVGLDNEPVRG